MTEDKYECMPRESRSPQGAVPEVVATPTVLPDHGGYTWALLVVDVTQRLMETSMSACHENPGRHGAVNGETQDE